jgi:hypothetical protein
MMFKTKPEVIFIILGVIFIFGLMYMNIQKEGFTTQGSIPSASQTSAIPQDIPGATSTNPTASKPQAKDIEDIQERLKNFELLTQQKFPRDTNLSGSKLANVLTLQRSIPTTKRKLDKALVNFDSSGFSLGEFVGLRARINTATADLRGAQVSGTKAKPVEVQATLDLLNKFSTLATEKRPENTDLAGSMRNDVVNLRDSISNYENRLLAAIAQSDTSTFTSRQINDLTSQIARSINALQNAKPVGATANATANATPQLQTSDVIPSPQTADEAYAAVVATEPMPTVVAGSVGTITLEKLTELVKRINEEHLRLANLRSTAPSVVARIQQLDKLKADISDIITKVKNKQMKLEDVPITPFAADKFLANLKSNKGTLPPLLVPTGSLPTAIKAPKGVADYAGIPAGEQAVQKLLSAARDLRWSMEVRLEYDPHIKTRESMLTRLENIIKNLNKLSVSQTSIPPQVHEKYLTELNAIQNNFRHDPAKYRGGDVGSMSRLSTNYGRIPHDAPKPSEADISMAQGAGFGPQDNTFPHGEISPDVQIRPGFIMNDDQIARRASAASYIPVAGGPDYKARALEICRQAKAGNIADGASLGCIHNPDEVGPNYDWKGNYTMVCNRLGDSWGRGYPAQFGCPPYDPTAKFSSGF